MGLIFFFLLTLPVTLATQASSERFFELGSRKRVCVRTFKGQVVVDLRDYYRDKTDGQMKPGKKGLSLSVAQWEKLQACAGLVCDAAGVRNPSRQTGEVKDDAAEGAAHTGWTTDEDESG